MPHATCRMRKARASMLPVGEQCPGHQDQAVTNGAPNYTPYNGVGGPLSIFDI